MKYLKSLWHFLFAHVAYWYYGRPARNLIVIGVTGTKGKSTTCRLIASVLEEGGYKVGMLTTVEFQIGKKRWYNDKKMTMLGRGEIQKLLREMVNVGCEYAVIETSSEGILQYRHLGLKYDTAVFTNLGTEHSERHGGFENLRRDKGKMFAALTSGSPKTIKGKKILKNIIVNGDDNEAGFYLSYNASKKYAFSLDNNLKLQRDDIQIVKGEKVTSVPGGNAFKVGDQVYNLLLPGDFNIYNGLAAVTIGLAAGIDPQKIDHGLLSVSLVPGRMEFIEEGQAFKVVVDYAHEPMSYEALFSTLKTVTPGKIIAVIGSDGGGRDIEKRMTMGEIAGQLADAVIVTDVNCFDEDPLVIAEMLARGARKSGKSDGKNLFIEVNRRLAINKAFSLAGPGDVVAITAKGTEPYMCVAGGKKIPWDDRAVARQFLKNYVH